MRSADPGNERPRGPMRGRVSAAIVAAISVGLADSGAPVCADSVYRWLDARGVPHFSDQPPPRGARYPEQLNTPNYARTPGLPYDYPYSIANQLQRLEAYRSKLARERLEQRRAEPGYQDRAREQELREHQRDAPEPPSVSVDPAPYPGQWGAPRHRHAWPVRPTRRAIPPRE